VLLILCSRYCRNRRKKKTNEQPIESVIDQRIVQDESISEEKNVIRLPPSKSSPRFVLGNPFNDAEVQPVD
jgi:hypothetical protein